MKVLWFANNACGSVRRHKGKVTIGGWLISLEDELKKNSDINLNVSYISLRSENDFEFEGVHYYPVLREVPSNGMKRVMSRFESFKKSEWKILPQLLEVVNRVKPDIIHIHGTEDCFGLIQDHVTDIPIVFSIQGLIAPYTEKFFSGFAAEFVRKHEHWSNQLRKVSVSDAYKSFQERSNRELHYLNKARYVIGRTQFDHYIPLLCNPDVRLFQGEEILRREFYTLHWNKNSFCKPLKIVSTISGGIFKGFETALHTASLLKKYASFDFEWQIIGYDENNEWVKIAEKYKKIKSQSVNIKFLGRLQAKEMANILTNSDVYVQVSHIENSPNSVCEAMLLGMPIIASFAGGTSSMLKDGVEGILVQDGDPFVLAGAIVHLQNNFGDAKYMGAKARERAKVRQNPDSVCMSIIGVYDNILKQLCK